MLSYVAVDDLAEFPVSVMAVILNLESYPYDLLTGYALTALIELITPSAVND